MSDSPKDTMSPPGDLPQQIEQIRLSTPSTDAGRSSEANSNLDAASNRAQSLQVPSRSPSRPSHRSGSKTPDAGGMSNSQRSSSSSQGLSLLQTELLGPPSADEVLRDLISPVMADSSTTPAVFSKHGRKRSLDEDEDEDWLEGDNDHHHHHHPRPWKRDRRDGLEEELDEMIAEQHFSSTSLLDSDDDDEEEESEPKTPTGLDHPDPPENNNHNDRQTPEAGEGEGGVGPGTGGLEGVPRRGPLPYRGARGTRQGPTDQSL